MSLDHSLADSGWPYRAPRTGSTASCASGGSFGKRFAYHSQYGLLMVPYRGAFGGGASAKALDASASMVM